MSAFNSLILAPRLQGDLTYRKWRGIIRKGHEAHTRAFVQAFLHLPMDWLIGEIGTEKFISIWPEDMAQEIMYDAWETATGKKRIALARKALEVSADCADAYVLLAEETARSVAEAIEHYQKGVQAGERAIGKKAFEDDVGYFWGILETRPYMRARAGLAACLWEVGRREEAVAHYREMLRLNPNDNQGIRDLLMPCLIVLDRDHDAEKLFARYSDDCMAVWVYSRVLLDFRKHGDSTVARESLQAALKENKHVPAYLLGRKRMPRSLPELYGRGDENETILYFRGNVAAWKVT